MNDELFQKRRALIGQLYKNYCKAFGVLIADDVKFLGVATLLESLSDQSGAIVLTTELIGNATTLNGEYKSGTIVLGVKGNALASISDYEPVVSNAQTAVSVEMYGDAIINSSIPTDSITGFCIGENGLANVTEETFASEGELETLLGMHAKAVDAIAVPTEGAVLSSLNMSGLTSIVEYAVYGRCDVNVEPISLDALANIADTQVYSGLFKMGTVSATNAHVTVDSYTVEENEAGGLTYTINASEYTLDGKTLKVW